MNIPINIITCLFKIVNWWASRVSASALIISASSYLFNFPNTPYFCFNSDRNFGYLAL